MEHILLLNPENATEEEVATYKLREAARAVVVDEAGNIALLHATTDGYYKLPGGGLEGEEDPRVALDRECEEEIGCKVEVLGEIGIITEYRKMFEIKQVSYCYFAKVNGEKGNPAFTESELEKGFEIVWQPFEDALASLRSGKTVDKEGSSYIVPRDIAFLEAGKPQFIAFRAG